MRDGDRKEQHARRCTTRKPFGEEGNRLDRAGMMCDKLINCRMALVAGRKLSSQGGVPLGAKACGHARIA